LSACAPSCVAIGLPSINLDDPWYKLASGSRPPISGASRFYRLDVHRQKFTHAISSQPKAVPRLISSAALRP
jgi:hypothetical protein